MSDTHTTAQALLERPLTLLFTSVGNEAIHGFVEDLRRRAPRWRLLGTDIRELAAGLYRCDEHFLLPRCDDPRYLDHLAALCRAQAVDLLVPLSTRDQDYFSQPQVQRRLGLPIMVSDPEVVAAANRKVGLMQALQHQPELLPGFCVVHNSEQALEALQRSVARTGAALLKVDQSTGGAGMICVGDPSQDAAPAVGRRWWSMELLLELHRRPQSPALLALMPELKTLRHGPWPALVVDYLPGAEYSVDLLCDRGQALGGAVRLRHTATGGLATAATVVDEPDVMQAAQRVARALNLHYLHNIQFRRDAQGQPRLLEINPRIPGTISLTVEAGLNLPLFAFCMALGGQPPALPEPEFGLTVLRHHGNVYARRLSQPWEPAP